MQAHLSGVFLVDKLSVHIVWSSYELSSSCLHLHPYRIPNWVLSLPSIHLPTHSQVSKADRGTHFTCRRNLCKDGVCAKIGMGNLLILFAYIAGIILAPTPFLKIVSAFLVVPSFYFVTLKILQTIGWVY